MDGRTLDIRKKVTFKDLFRAYGICTGSKKIYIYFEGCYPATISKQPKTSNQQIEDVSFNAGKTTPGYGKIKDLPKVIWALLTNPTYMMINFGGAADGLTIAGLSAFLPKVMQSQYGFSAGIASALIGVLVIPAGGMFI